MKRFLYLSLAALMMLAAVSCKKAGNGDSGNDNGSEIVMPNPYVETLAASEIEANSAFLHARIDFSGASRDNVYYGFFWGTSENLEGTYTPGEGALDENNAYSAEILGLTPETEYWFKAFVEIDGKSYSGGILNLMTEGIPVVIPEAVDLGIVVNGKTIKWGSFNLGATKPEEYGYYYAWGETEPKDDYGWSTYKFGTSESGPFSKYNTVDNKTVLETGPEGDDVASKLLGGKWRMPTREEVNAIKDQCAWTIEDLDNGQKVQKATGPNGKSLYFPYAGNRGDGNSLYNAGSYGYYWSSSLDASLPNKSCYLVFGLGNIATIDFYRCYGLSVRPVCEE